MRRLISILVATHSALAFAAPRQTPRDVCVRAAESAERHWRLPSHLLLAIGEVESGRRDPATGRRMPWPWTLNAAGADYAFLDRATASTAAAMFLAHGVTSIDVGCFQVNLHYHLDAFASPGDGFDPQANAEYAGSFLRRLFDRSGSWEQAIGAYHSGDPALGDPYRARVLRVWRSVVDALPATTPDPHVILAAAATTTIPVYTLQTLPPRLRRIIATQATNLQN